MKKNKPQKNIPDGWQEVRLANIGSFSKGAGILKDQVLENGYNAIRYGELYTKYNFKIEKVHSHISEDIISQTKKIKYGDILFAGSGETINEIGKSATYLLKEECYAGGDIIVFSPKNADSLFLAYFLNIGEGRKKLSELGQGQSVVHIYKSEIEKMRLHLPSLPEQKRIVAVLESWDGVIDKLTKKIKIKKNIKEGLIQNLLTGMIRLDGFNYKWEQCKVGDICEIKKGQELSKEKLSSNGKYKCILYGELYTKYSELINNVSSRTNFKEGIVSSSGDILIPASTTTSAMDLAIAACLNKKNVLLGGDINILRAKKKYDSRFLALYLTHAKKHDLARLAQGITIVHLYGKDFKKLSIEIPEIKEQSAIANIIVAADEEIKILEKKLTILKDQKKYLLNNLITGTIRTKA